MQFAHFQFDPETDRLGEGPLSEVYKATDLRLGRTVALKILRAHAEIDPQADTRFLREAKHTSNLAHPNIATIYEYGKDQGTSFIAMEYLQGRTLDKIIKDQTLGYEECQRIALQVTEALALVHARELVHRDLKPGNIMVQDDGSVKLLDFGIARANDEATITQHGMLVGTPLYMSPEQVRGEELDVRSDIFSLGSVLYHVMTGALPFPGQSFPEVCMAILDAKPRPPSVVRQGFPKPIEEFILRCLRPDPAERFADASEAHGALLAIGTSLSATNGVVQPRHIEGAILIPPLECGGEDPTSCHVLAAGLRRDLAGELERIKGLTVHLADAPPPDGGVDFELRGRLSVEGSKGSLELDLQRLARKNGRAAVSETTTDRVQAEDADDWGLQAALVRSAVRTLRKRLTEMSLRPVARAQRDTELARRLAAQAREVLHRGTTKHLMAATSTFRRALEADPHCPLAYAGLAEALVRKYLYWDGDVSFLDEARDQVARALTLDPRCAEAHTALGFSYHLSGHPTDAQREYRTAIQTDTGEWLAHRLLGAVMAREGNFKTAAGMLQKAVGLQPHHIGSYDHLFVVFQRLDRYEESLEIADRGISAAKAHLRTTPDNQEARTHMAMLMARMGMTEDARRHAAEARALAPKDGYTAYFAACAYALNGDVTESIEALTQAIARGFYVKSELVQNTDLDVLRGLEEFQELVS